MPIFKKAVKIFFLLIAISLIIFSIDCFWYSKKVYKRFDKVWNEKLIDLEVDLSKSGNYNTDLQCSHDYSHGIVVFLQMLPEDINEISREELFSTLDYDCVIKDDHRQAILKNADANTYLLIPPPADLISLASIRYPYRKGEFELKRQGKYELNLTVNTGYENLSGKKQRLVARYWLCPCETLSAIYAIIVGIVFTLIAITILLILWKVSKKKKPLDENIAP